MQQCQDKLDFQIETPSDQELARRFADRQRELSELEQGERVEAPRYHNKHSCKPRNRKSKQQKKQERINRAKPKVVCEGFEISPGTGIMSGCDQSCGDCPTCGK